MKKINRIKLLTPLRKPLGKNQAKKIVLNQKKRKKKANVQMKERRIRKKVKKSK
jgi:hypothetical protein